MKELLIQLRAMNLFAHSAHNLVGRSPFHSDHEFFSKVYEDLDEAYDAVAERIIGLFGENALELSGILAMVSAKLQGAPSVNVKENSVFYMKLLQMEQELCALVSKMISEGGVSPGTEQLIGDICDKSESRQYLIKQRLKK